MGQDDRTYYIVYFITRNYISVIITLQTNNDKHADFTFSFRCNSISIDLYPHITILCTRKFQQHTVIIRAWFHHCNGIGEATEAFIPLVGPCWGVGGGPQATHRRHHHLHCHLHRHHHYLHNHHHFLQDVD